MAGLRVRSAALCGPGTQTPCAGNAADSGSHHLPAAGRSMES